MNFTKHLKTSYTIFTITITMMIVLISFTVAYFISLQKEDAIMINKSGRQRMLSQRITKQALFKLLDNQNNLKSYSDQKLTESVTEWKEAQTFLAEKQARK